MFPTEFSAVWAYTPLLGFFYAGMGVCGQLIYLSVKEKAKRNEINQIVKKHFRFLSFAELIDLCGSFFYQMAIAAAPTVVYVAAMLQFLPIACMVYAILLLFIFTNPQTKAVARSQLKEGMVKTMASIFTFVGAVLIIGSSQVESFLRDYFVNYWEASKSVGDSMKWSKILSCCSTAT